MICPKCGEEIANDSLFCEYCGTQIIKDKVKRVDIRWALLPAMLITTYALFELWWLVQLDNNFLWVIGAIPFTLSLLIFIYTLPKAFKKEVPKSFLLMMLMLLIANGTMEYGLLNPEVRYETDTDVWWTPANREESYKEFTTICQTSYSSDDPDFVRERGDYFRRRTKDMIEDALRANGACDIYFEDNIYKEYHASMDYVPIFILCVVLFFFFIYLVYAFIAHKKGWKF